MKERLTFVVGTGAALGGVALLARSLGQVQLGPTWEVPAKSTTNLLVSLVVSLVLYGVAILMYFIASGFRVQTRNLRRCFWIVLSVGLFMMFSCLFVQPSQWPIRHSTLSGFVLFIATPVVVACSIVWVLLSKLGWAAVGNAVGLNADMADSSK